MGVLTVVRKKIDWVLIASRRILCCPLSYRLTHLSSSKLDYLIVGGAIILYIHIYFRLIPTTDPKVVVILCNVSIADPIFFHNYVSVADLG